MKNSEKYLEKIKMTAMVYCRVYSKESKNPQILLEKQKKAILDFASKHGYSVLNVFLETSQSGNSFGGLEFQEMLKYFEANPWRVKFLIVLDEGRLSCSPAELKRFKIFLRLSGIKVVSVVSRMLRQRVKQPKQPS